MPRERTPRHPVLTGLPMDEPWLHRKARICLCFPQEENTTEEAVLLFEEETSFWENKRQLDDGIKRRRKL